MTDDDKKTICEHEVQIKGLCAICGLDLKDMNNNKNIHLNDDSISMVHSVPDLKINKKKGQELGQNEKNCLFDSQKLVLLLDLDSTIIHSTTRDVETSDNSIFHYQMNELNPNGHSFVNKVWYHTKIRNGLYKFLDDCNDLYELHIVTFGNRSYATNIVSRIDPHKIYFSDRILSRDELLNKSNKTENLNSLFPCGTDFVVIVDDRSDVWNHSPLCLQVKPFVYFDTNGMPLMKANKNDSDYLARVFSILSMIHQQFFEKNTLVDNINHTTATILGSIKRNVLKGQKIYIHDMIDDDLKSNKIIQTRHLIEMLGAEEISLEHINQANIIIVLACIQTEKLANGPNNNLDSQSHPKNLCMELLNYNWLQYCAYYLDKLSFDGFRIDDESIIEQLYHLIYSIPFKKQIKDDILEDDNLVQLDYMNNLEKSQNMEFTAAMIDDLLDEISDDDDHEDYKNLEDKAKIINNSLEDTDNEINEINSSEDEQDELEKYVNDIEYNLSGDEDNDDDANQNNYESSIPEDEIPFL